MTNVYEFASVAEAVAHFHREGFETVRYGEKTRAMRKPLGDGCQEVVITHNGLLDVNAVVLTYAA